MALDDVELARRLDRAAPVVEPVDVLGQVGRRRVRRQRARRLEAASAAVAIVFAIGATILLTRGDGSSPQVAAPGAGLIARVIDGGAAVSGARGRHEALTPIALDADPGPLRAPIFSGTTALSVASDDVAPNGAPRSRVVRIDGAHVVDTVDFKARVVSITEGEGARWAVTSNPTTNAGTVPDTFLKRIADDGSTISTQLPPSAEVLGPLAAVGGAVWIPVRDGVLQFDVSGAYVRSILLTRQSTRTVASGGKFAVVTDGSRLLQLDPIDGSTSELATATGRVVGYDSRTGRYLFDHGGRVALGTTDPGNARNLPALPTSFAATSFGSSLARTWVIGTVDGAPAIVLLDDRGVRATVILDNAGTGAALAWTGPHTVTAVSGGRLVEIPVP